MPSCSPRSDGASTGTSPTSCVSSLRTSSRVPIGRASSPFTLTGPGSRRRRSPRCSPPQTRPSWWRQGWPYATSSVPSSCGMPRVTRPQGPDWVIGCGRRPSWPAGRPATSAAAAFGPRRLPPRIPAAGRGVGPRAARPLPVGGRAPGAERGRVRGRRRPPTRRGGSGGGAGVRRAGPGRAHARPLRLRRSQGAACVRAVAGLGR